MKKDYHKLGVGSRVEFQNLVGTVVSKDGPDTWTVKLTGSNATIQAMSSQLTVVLNEGHMESERLNEFNHMLND